MPDIRIYGVGVGDDEVESLNVNQIKKEIAIAAGASREQVSIRLIGKVGELVKGYFGDTLSVDALPFADIVLFEGRTAEQKRAIAAVLASHIHIKLLGGITFIEIPPENYFPFPTWIQTSDLLRKGG